MKCTASSLAERKTSHWLSATESLRGTGDNSIHQDDTPPSRIRRSSSSTSFQSSQGSQPLHVRVHDRSPFGRGHWEFRTRQKVFPDEGCHNINRQGITNFEGRKTWLSIGSAKSIFGRGDQLRCEFPTSLSEASRKFLRDR